MSHDLCRLTQPSVENVDGDGVMTSNMQIVSERRVDTPNLSIMCTRMDIIVSIVNNRNTEPSTLSGISINKRALKTGLLRLIANFLIIRFTITIINLSRSAVIRT